MKILKTLNLKSVKNDLPFNFKHWKFYKYRICESVDPDDYLVKKNLSGFFNVWTNPSYWCKVNLQSSPEKYGVKEDNWLMLSL